MSELVQKNVGAGVEFDASLASHTPECFTRRMLTPKDVEYFEAIDTFGSLTLARNKALEAPGWELFRAWEIDAAAFEAEQQRISREQAAAHTLGQALLSKPEHEFEEGTEFVNRFQLKRVKVSFKQRRGKILTSREQKFLAEQMKKMDADRKRLEALEKADAMRQLKAEKKKQEKAEKEHKRLSDKVAFVHNLMAPLIIIMTMMMVMMTIVVVAVLMMTNNNYDDVLLTGQGSRSCCRRSQQKTYNCPRE